METPTGNEDNERKITSSRRPNPVVIPTRRNGRFVSDGRADGSRRACGCGSWIA